jgi:hypothetical protein
MTVAFGLVHLRAAAAGIENESNGGRATAQVYSGTMHRLIAVRCA